MPLSADERRRIEQVAAARAFESLRSSGLISRTHEICPTPSEGITPSAKLFAEKVVFLEHVGDWGKETYLPKNMAENVCLFYLLQLRHIVNPTDRLKGYPSWLYFGNVNGLYGAVIDEEAVQNKFLRVEEAERYRLYLYFHELGHMLLHRNDLRERKVNHDPKWAQGGQASKRMELEADVAAKCFAHKCGGIVFPEEFYFKEQE